MFDIIFQKRHPEVGARPGTLVIPEQSPAPRFKVIRYNADDVTHADIENVEQLREHLVEGCITWVDVQGFGNPSLMQQIGDLFQLHPLMLEDIINAPQRPKVEEFGEQLLIIVRMVSVTTGAGIDMEQVSIVVGKNYVVTFQEKYGDILDPVRRRIGSGMGLMRKRGADYLAYAIADTIVDGYYPVLEEIGLRLEELEHQVIVNPTPDVLRTLNSLKNHLVNLRRGIWPQRDAVNQLVRGDHPSVDEEVRIYLRDTYDHCIQTSEVAEMYREMVTGLMNLYLSSVANRTNEVMKVLTIMASIFIPLTFLAGIYGMNFDHMPELHVWWAYPIIWFTMIAVAAGMLVYFRRLGWIGSQPPTEQRGRPSE